MNSDKDIKLNDKFISTLKFCKNDDKNKPYKTIKNFMKL